jgi:hypothetical protein
VAQSAPPNEPMTPETFAKFVMKAQLYPQPQLNVPRHEGTTLEVRGVGSSNLPVPTIIKIKYLRKLSPYRES